jgi:hypothetical protein
MLVWHFQIKEPPDTEGTKNINDGSITFLLKSITITPLMLTLIFLTVLPLMEVARANPRCRIPDASIQFSRWPLFFARDVLREVVDWLDYVVTKICYSIENINQ